MWYSDVFDFFIAKPEVANAVAAMSSTILAGVAVFLSLISLCVSFLTLRHQREHNRLSVRPLAYITIGDYENQLYVKLRNNGTGPMVVKFITVIGAPDQSQPLVSAMPQLHPEVNWTNFVEDCSGRSVPVGGELVLLDLSSECSSLQDQFSLSRDRVRLALGKLKVCVEYTDIYGTKLPASNRDLQFFHRMLSATQLVTET